MFEVIYEEAMHRAQREEEADARREEQRQLRIDEFLKRNGTEVGT